MKTIQLFALLALAFGFYSCGDDDDVALEPVEAETISNLHAPSTSVPGPGGPPEEIGPFTKFDFATGQTTTSDTEWDIAFRGTTILVNGGESMGTTDEPERNGNAAAYITVNTFSEVIEVNISSFRQDSASELAIIPESGMGWYNYDGTNPMAPRITPIDGRILVFRTRDNKYAKVEILSYYKDNPSTVTDEIAQNDFRYYTFNYEYQPNEGVTTF